MKNKIFIMIVGMIFIFGIFSIITIKPTTIEVPKYNLQYQREDAKGIITSFEIDRILNELCSCKKCYSTLDENPIMFNTTADCQTAVRKMFFLDCLEYDCSGINATLVKTYENKNK